MRCLMKTCTALATPRPPSRRATRATRPRKLPKRERVRVRRCWSSATVRTLRRSAESRGRKRSATFWASAPAGSLRYASWRAREPRVRRPVSSTRARGDEDARAEGAADAHLPGHVLDGGAQDEARLAERDLVARPGAERDEQGRRRRSPRRSAPGAPTRRRARSGWPRSTGRPDRRPAPGRAASSGRPAGGPSRRSSRRGRPRPAGPWLGAPRRGAPRRCGENAEAAEIARSAPSSARASRRTESRRLSVNELMATRAATPIATARTMSRPRRRAARDSRQARNRTKGSRFRGCGAEAPPRRPLDERPSPRRARRRAGG